ncbi:MAG: hypothetical protein GF310_07050 [candidate division Zixibacteria bacterium]|nr:hypothetical protein [candidate division Zixibacteria bacterium]
MIDKAQNGITPEIPEDLEDAVRHAQNQLEEYTLALNNRIAELSKKLKIRRGIAITVKITFAVAGVFLTSGFIDIDVIERVFGAAIALIIALDSVLGFHNRMLTLASAKNAYKRLREKIISKHGEMITDVIKIRDRKSEESANYLLANLKELFNLLDKTKNEIEHYLAKKEYENLSGLKLSRLNKFRLESS